MKPSKTASVLLAAVLMTVPALAAEKSVAPLQEGKPAGARQAALTGAYAPFVYVGIFAAAAAIIATTAGSGSLTPSSQVSATATTG